MMLSTYSFNKIKFQAVFGFSNIFLGAIDAFIYLSLGLGAFFRYSIINSHKPVLCCLVTSFPMAFGFAFIPTMAFIYDKYHTGHATPLIYILFIIAAGLFGFFQLNFFPAMLTIFGHSFNLKNDGRIVGIWSSKSNAGNIIGFLMSNILVYSLNIRWQITMFICSFCLVFMSILLTMFVKNPDFGKEEQKIQTLQFLKFFRKIWSYNQFKLYILAFSFFKAVIYSYELWTPKFLTEVGYKDYSGYVPIIFDSSTLFGSFVVGMIYKKEQNTDLKHKETSGTILFLIKYKFFVPGILAIIISFCYMVVPGILGVYFTFGAIMGFCLGAIYNGLQNNEVMNYTNNEPTKLDMFATINLGIGSAMVGVSQFVIGFSLDIGKDSSNSALVKKGLIYVVIGVIAMIATVISLVRTCHEKAVPQSLRQGRKSQQVKEEMLGIEQNEQLDKKSILTESMETSSHQEDKWS